MTIKNFLKKIIKKIKPDVKNVYIWCSNKVPPDFTGYIAEKTKYIKIISKPYETTIAEFKKVLNDYYKILSENGLIKIICDKTINYDNKLLRTCLEKAGYIHITFEDNAIGFDVTARKPSYHNFKLNSGERQIGKKLSEIRADHINRYLLAVDMIKKYCSEKFLYGLDIFCGNGYGEEILTKNLNTEVIAYDGSLETINFAGQYYQSKNVKFLHKMFPFELEENIFDFVISLESVEHIKEYGLFVKELSKTLKNDGILIISTPNERKNNLIKNNNAFHYRHFNQDEFIELFKHLDMELIEFYGQDCYKINDEGYIIETLEAEYMNVIKDYDGQFNIYVFKKNK
jgi:SAM-dependent methyltransferase